MRILVVSTSRADFGLLIPVIQELNNDNKFQVQVCEIGSHISLQTENHKLLQGAGFTAVDFSIRIEVGDSPNGKAQLASSTIIAITKYLESESIDAVMILGDRYEALAVAYAASLTSTPVIHLVGGDITMGSIDDNYRHAITKLSKIHFASNSLSKSRILQLGEEPQFVHVSGSPGLDSIGQMEFLSRDSLQQFIGLEFTRDIILVAFHPDSHYPNQVKSQTLELICALREFARETTIVLTGPNYDQGFTIIENQFDNFSREFPESVAYVKSLGSLRFLSLMKASSVMVGNSSSGYYEAPSLSLPVVDLGNRQKGRIPHELLINVPIIASEIAGAMRRALTFPHAKIVNPYWSTNSGGLIRRELSKLSLETLCAPKIFQTLALESTL